ncbi:hypothetical protein F441_19906 [Phytophthora nicotianae CJ01A1]|uniref:RxLR effector protein n=6 Tax=Phytophthora nicotianae TaxID=4792 RepID=W2PKP1_PHYN3|nr:hypothetical protein PPTG_17823 [Phytophthora nicotianae INRA-310]ETI33293.1 hypothetical protein F443_20034 [Phytophthora nicotianae P1569]ETK73614.1 hypothetical protein L915_19485 [Phytophthora nicotianae]ETO62023.1 hypothetical protein F444_20038 [Phytophthora nicotianae P1976]ETP03109.1 hypothetical protein F441_19906 [Phytophthora nicotianae CJ01A1]ETP31281.1 hypothetical protein F442_19848 [Phytophthora nicotianae P10297]KUF87505.1 hypothetical protein AM587_10005806 [Phytophthora n
MRFSLFLVALVATCVGYSSNLVLAEKRTLAADSIHTNFRRESVSIERKLTIEAAFDVDDEERVLERLKGVFQRATQSVKLFQRNPAAIKEVENLKNSPVVAQSIQSVKKNPVMVERLNSLKQNPQILKSLQDQPAGQSITKLQTFVTGSKAKSDGPSFIVCFLLIMGGFTATLLLVNLITQV